MWGGVTRGRNRVTVLDDIAKTFDDHQLCSKMPPPSQLAIASGSLQRLVKEETSYYKELTQQETRLEKLLANKDEDENREFLLRQEVGVSFSNTLNRFVSPYPTVAMKYALCVVPFLPLGEDNAAILIDHPAYLLAERTSTFNNIRRFKLTLNQRAAIEETKAVFPPLRERIKNAIMKLEDKLEAAQEGGSAKEEITRAKDTIQLAKAAVEKE